MAKQAKKPNSKLVIGILAVVAIVIIVVAIVVVIIKNNTLNDSYFVSDGTKYVLTLDSADVSMDNPEYNPIKTHLVYTYSGDEITGLKAYYEYQDNAAAKAAADYIKQNYEEEAQSRVSADGKYVIFTAEEATYQGLTASDIKQQIEFMELLKNINTEDAENAEAESTTTE